MSEQKLRVSVLMLYEGKIPLFYREKNNDWWWELPGGKIEEGEDYEQAAIRETEQELDIDVEFVKKLGEMRHPKFPNTHIIFVECKYLSGIPYNKDEIDHKDMRLFEPEKAIEMLQNNHMQQGSRINQQIEFYIRAMTQQGQHLGIESEFGK